MSDSLKGRVWSEEARTSYMASELRSVKVINVKTLEIYKSVKEANNSLGWIPGKLGKYLRGDRVNYTDYMFLKDYDKLKLNE